MYSLVRLPYMYITAHIGVSGVSHCLVMYMNWDSVYVMWDGISICIIPISMHSTCSWTDQGLSSML